MAPAVSFALSERSLPKAILPSVPGNVAQAGVVAASSPQNTASVVTSGITRVWRIVFPPFPPGRVSNHWSTAF